MNGEACFGVCMQSRLDAHFVVFQVQIGDSRVRVTWSKSCRTGTDMLFGL
jgi:hypothetical protein